MEQKNESAVNTRHFANGFIVARESDGIISIIFREVLPYKKGDQPVEVSSALVRFSSKLAHELQKTLADMLGDT